MSSHAACPTKDGFITIACVSCYCNSCLHVQFCGGWTEHRVSTSINIGTEEAHEENTSFESKKQINRIVKGLVIKISKKMCRSEKSRPKMYGYIENVVPFYDDLSFRRMFRMSRSTFNILCDYLKDCPELQTQGKGKEPVSVEKQLLFTLWYVGSLSTINKIADRFGVAESTALVCRDKIFVAIYNNLLHRFLQWPT